LNIYIIRGLLMSETKTVEMLSKPPKKIKIEKEKKKRIITTTKRWTFSPYELTPESQLQILMSNLSDITITDRSYTFILAQIHTKLYSYKSQDLEKGRYDGDNFAKVGNVLDKLRECFLDCFYCKSKVALLYEYVRDPKQWTLERIDNSIGHTADNVVISCLSCNLRRRTMYFERFLFTKNMVIEKVG